jgi:hypothetical protein
MGDLGEYGFGVFPPEEDFGVFIMSVQEVGYRPLQFADATEDSAPDSFVREFREEPLYHVQPQRRSRREVRVEPGMLGKPLLNLGCLMSLVVVRNQMEVQVPRRAPGCDPKPESGFSRPRSRPMPSQEG